MTVSIVTDSTADIPDDLLQQYQIHVVPNLVSIDGQNLQDGTGISRQDFYEPLPSMKTTPTTGTVPASAPAGSGVWSRYAAVGSPGLTNLIRIEGTSSIHDWQVEGRLIGGSAEFGPTFPPDPGAEIAPGTIEARVSVTRSLQMQPRALVASVLGLVLLLTAWATPFAPSTLVPLETAVALALQAIAAAATPPPSETLAPLPTAEPDALPRDIFFRNRDAAGNWQVFRLDADGHTIQQVTFEPFNVDGYDASPMDRSIAFITNNQLYLVDAAGAGRRMLVDGGVVEVNNPWVHTLSAPVWSQDGQSLAYGHGGLTGCDATVAVALGRIIADGLG